MLTDCFYLLAFVYKQRGGNGIDIPAVAASVKCLSEARKILEKSENDGARNRALAAELH